MFGKKAKKNGATLRFLNGTNCEYIRKQAKSIMTSPARTGRTNKHHVLIERTIQLQPGCRSTLAMYGVISSFVSPSLGLELLTSRHSPKMMARSISCEGKKPEKGFMARLG